MATLLLLEIPTLTLVGDLLKRQLLPAIVPILIFLANIITVILLGVCTFKDPGILPQNVNNY